MLIRKTALLASLLAGTLGASNAQAGCFGKRNCCQATPIVCPPCAPMPAPFHGMPPSAPACIYPSTGGFQPFATSVCDMVVAQSPFANRPRMQITQDVIIQKRLSDGSLVQETVQQTRAMTNNEEVGYLLEKLQELDSTVFGPTGDRSPTLEGRVKQLENSPAE